MSEDEVWFYEHKEKPYGVFSNFAEIGFDVDNNYYPTSEAYYQSKKFEGPDSTTADLEYAKIIASQNTGNKAAILARQTKPIQNYKWAQELWTLIQQYKSKGVKIREDWDNVKNNVMRVAVYNKFATNPKLKNILISTSPKRLAEHTHRDDYWGDNHPKNNPNVSGDGKNMLGKILEEVRYILVSGQELRILNPSNKTMSDRYEHMFVKSGKWLIPGLLLCGDTSIDECIQLGFRYIVSDDTQYGCIIKNNVLLANWKDDQNVLRTTRSEDQDHTVRTTRSEDPKNITEIAKTIETAISRGLSVVIPSKHIKIAQIAVKNIYGIK